MSSDTETTSLDYESQLEKLIATPMACGHSNAKITRTTVACYSDHNPGGYLTPMYSTDLVKSCATPGCREEHTEYTDLDMNLSPSRPVVIWREADGK